jgi:hypothetical protein
MVTNVSWEEEMAGISEKEMALLHSDAPTLCCST